MKIEILDQAERISSMALRFTKDSRRDWGIISLIPSLQTLNRFVFMPGFTDSTFVIIDFLPSDSRLPFIIRFRVT
jgi:hypothetical protein